MSGLDEFALMVAKDILIFKWIFIPETRCIRIFTCLKNENEKVIDVRDIPEEELYGRNTARELLEKAMKKGD